MDGNRKKFIYTDYLHFDSKTNSFIAYRFYKEIIEKYLEDISSKIRINIKETIDLQEKENINEIDEANFRRECWKKIVS